jgi:hypothetical protein
VRRERRRKRARRHHAAAGGPTMSKEPKLREAAAVDTYPADMNLSTEPATTTAPTHREHHRSRSFLSSPLVSFL